MLYRNFDSVRWSVSFGGIMSTTASTEEISVEGEEEDAATTKPAPATILLDERGLTPRQADIIAHHKLLPKDLDTGFGLHTFRSLELAIIAAKEPPLICKCIACQKDSASKTSSTSESALLTEIDYEKHVAEAHLSFLMGLGAGGAEEENAEELAVGQAGSQREEEENLINGGTEAMRQAQRYLREHRIFEFFQFLIAHLLSECPDNPINFLINLLDKCLIYRAGISEAPLLYTKKHIECLFNLMDRMRTGFIDNKQYKTGMNTFGVKSFNPKPPLNEEGQVPRVFFIEEAYECEKDLLNDMLRRRSKHSAKYKKPPKAPPPSTAALL